LELVHGDLCGPISPANPGGRSYFLLLVDDATRYMWVALLTTKDMAADAIKHLQAMAEKQSGKKLRTLPKDVAFHPVTSRPLHADFLRLAKNATVHVNVPVVFINEELSPGLKRGAVLNIVRHDLELVCAADKIPDEISIDVTGFDVGDSIHISHVTLPAGAESAITDRDYTIATIVAPSALKSEAGDTTTTEAE